MVTLSLMFLLGYVVPQFAAMYDSLDAPLPWFSRLVLGLACSCAVGGGAARGCRCWRWSGWTAKRRDPVFRKQLDAWLLERRFAGPLVAKVRDRAPGAHARHSAEWSVLLTALGIGRNVLGNCTLVDAVEAARTRSRTASACPLRWGAASASRSWRLQMIQVGESPAPDGMLLKTADTFEQKPGWRSTACWPRWCRW